MSGDAAWPELDPVIHAPARLQLCATLQPLDEADFPFLRQRLEVSDSVLSKHLSRLRNAGYVRVRSGAVQGRARKWAALTPLGRRALAAHLAALRAIVARADGEEE